jgi:hypothetical protein
MTSPLSSILTSMRGIGRPTVLGLASASDWQAISAEASVAP